MGGKGSQTTVQSSEPWVGVQPYLEEALGSASGLFGSGQLQFDPYQGQRVAGFTQPQQQAFGQIQQLASQPGIAQEAQTALSGLLDPSSYSQGLEGVRQEALSAAIPAATSAFSGSGLLDSTLAQQEVGRAATQAIAPIEYGAYQQAQNRALQAAQSAPAIQAAQYLPAQQLQQIGGQQQLLNQAQLDAQRQLYGEQQAAPYEALQRYAGLVYPGAGFGGTGSTTQSQDPGLLGTLGGIASIGSLFFSDRRLKTDIRPVGQTAGGTNLYEFRYLWSADTHVGVMADEVPHAIAGSIGGYSIVDYGEVM